MRTFLNLWRREMGAYLHSPAAYVVTVFFLIVTGFNFWFLVSLMSSEQVSGVQVLSQLFGSLFFWIPFLVVVPVLTMRLLAEEHRSGTLEVLMTSPVTETQVVLAKYFGALTLYALMWLPTLSYAFILRRYSAELTPVDPGALVGGYLGALVLGGFYLSVGVLCSALTRSQMVAALSCFAVLSISFFAGFLVYVSPHPLVREISGYASSVAHMLEFSRGVLDSRPLVLYFTGTLLVLFATIRAMEWRKW